MEYRLDKKLLLDIMGQWNSFLRRKVHLIACGGTAMTLMGVKPSTKDIDFIVPVQAEHKYLTGILADLGYKRTTGSGWQREGELFRFDLFIGERIHTTGLLESPLKQGNHTLLQEFSRLYIGILNEYDLVASKLFRGTTVDFEDCLMLVRARHDRIDIKRLKKHARDLASHDVGEARILDQIDHFFELLRQEGLNNG